jgi:uncharacterized protein (DUF427 family)
MRDRPPFDRIVKPGPGQESVWDYPRPPRVDDVPERVRVVAFGETIADTTQAIRVVETAGAPCYYVPARDCKLEALSKTSEWTICEWKGVAYAYDVAVGKNVSRAAAWSYPDPLTDLGEGYERIAGAFAFYVARVEACYVGDERARPQGGGYYGGWITDRIVGPIKGDPGSGNW